MMKTDIIIQARMASSRLPGKVLLDIGGKPMLEWVVERSFRTENANEVVTATTVDPSDDPVFEFCQMKGYRVERGSTKDVLDRYYQTAKVLGSEIIVRITADCPFIDPTLVYDAVNLMSPRNDQVKLNRKHQKTQYDYLANRLPAPWKRTYPIGLDIEIFTFSALEEAWKNAENKHQREKLSLF